MSRRCLAALQLFRSHESKLHYLRFKSDHPPFVIAHPQVVDRGHDLQPVSVGVEAPLLPSAHRPVQGVDTPFPSGVEYGLVLFIHDRTHCLIAAHVVHTVHAGLPEDGERDSGDADHGVAGDQCGQLLFS